MKGKEHFACPSHSAPNIYCFVVIKIALISFDVSTLQQGIYNIYSVHIKCWPYSLSNFLCKMLSSFVNSVHTTRSCFGVHHV